MTILNQSGQRTLNKLTPLSNYAASDISEAVRFSPALKNYLSFDYSNGADLHLRRNQSWIECALATILNTHSPKSICQAWSQVATEILAECFNNYFGKDSIALYAIGKLGSQELNLSSDVDLLLVAQQTSPSHLKALRQLQKLLSERTPKGFIFRLDFDLRPGGRNGPLIPTVDQLVDYYGNYGETWERLAFVRLKYIAGDAQVDSDVQTFVKKFTYRKHLDYTLLDDLKNLRTKIRHHYSSKSSDAVWDLKLGVGGIRDIELFVHALQVIHGGKNPELQLHNTSAALQTLRSTNILPPSDCDFLENHYWQLRSLENFVQAINDEQTHLFEKTSPTPSWANDLVLSLDSHLENCDKIVTSLLGTPPLPRPTIKPSVPAEASIWNEILQIEVLSRNKDRDEQARLQFLGDFYQTLQRQHGDTEKALLRLKDFIKSTRTKASFFTLLNRNHNLLDELSWLFGHSPYLSQILSSRPELIDSYVYRSQDLQASDFSGLLEQLVEKRLLGELINGSRFLEDRDTEILQMNLTNTADEICLSLLSALKTEFPSDLEVLTLGKWGGKELGFRSDLDFVMVTSEEPTELDIKVARRFINRLTEPRKGGNIYPIDMRLKPSGKAGPIVISYPQLCNYLSASAEIWERQAYLKARWLGQGRPSLSSYIYNRSVTSEDLVTLEKIRSGLIRTTPNGWDLKYVEGGLLDIELFSQTHLLTRSLRLQSSNTLDFLLSDPCLEKLRINYMQMRQFEQMLQLVSTEGGAKVVLNNESFQYLAKAFHVDAESLSRQLEELIFENVQILNRLDQRRLAKLLHSDC